MLTQCGEASKLDIIFQAPQFLQSSMHRNCCIIHLGKQVVLYA